MIATEVFLDNLEQEIIKKIKNSSGEPREEIDREEFKLDNFRYLQGLAFGGYTKFFSFISERIENNEALKEGFYSIHCKPNELAREIIADLLKARPDTIHSIIY